MAMRILRSITFVAAIGAFTRVDVRAAQTPQQTTGWPDTTASVPAPAPKKASDAKPAPAKADTSKGETRANADGPAKAVASGKADPASAARTETAPKADASPTEAAVAERERQIARFETILEEQASAIA